MKFHNGPYISKCADELGRELSKDEIISALDFLACEALQAMEKYQETLKKISSQRNNRFESTVGVVCNMADEVLKSVNIQL